MNEADASRRLPVIQGGADEARVPLFPRIGIVGLGLIGGSIALAARQFWPKGLVIAVDDKGVLEQAMVRHAIDVAADDPVVLADVDLLILAAPVRQNLALMPRLAEYVRGPAVVTDTGSTKREMVEAAAVLPPRLTFVGGHPLGGAARGGIEHARADLFTGRPWLFTPETRTDPHALEQLSQLVSTLGAVPHVLTAAAHDHLLAYISHLPQLVSSALMHVVGEAAAREGLALTGRGLQDVPRLASSPAGIWRDVCASNADEVGPALDAAIAVLRDLRNGLADETVERLFTSANHWRDELLACTSRD